ncbi:bifunctional hydroxymethylpyrimidine kinase/phosphomethylpyrimidine kinase [Massilia sp. SM-13]|uniref:bifunctional hydroxymethylpyrimidine kinase/phosphomethylpyrimidine kinase n=1 Tax=Pseudoduganella rhizocola TaxID=3382643 RepID=UPI0038B49B12
MSTRPCVLVFAGHDPSGGAGIAADMQAITALGAHALCVVTALTVQDNNRVQEVAPVDPALLRRQARALIASCEIAAVKVGIPGSAANAAAIAALIAELRALPAAMQAGGPSSAYTQPAAAPAASPAGVPQPGGTAQHGAARARGALPATAVRRCLPVVVDPVLASGKGDPLARGSALEALRLLLPHAMLLTPNSIEAAALGGAVDTVPHVLQTGGHDGGSVVVNRWRHAGLERSWHWPRLDGEYHGSGCTLAAAAAALLAQGRAMEEALDLAQAYTHSTLQAAYAIAAGQRIPLRHLT